MMTVNVLIGRGSGQVIMDENEMESCEVQGRVGRSWQQVLHEAREDENKLKRQWEQIAREAGEKRGEDIRGEGGTFDGMGYAPHENTRFPEKHRAATRVAHPHLT